MLYKDDTIFQHISFFQDVDLDELAQAAKVTKKKDVFQARSLLGRPVEISVEEESKSPQNSQNSAMFDIGGDQSNLNGTKTFLSEIQQEKDKESQLYSRSDINQSSIYFEKEPSKNLVGPCVQEDQSVNMFDQGDLSGFLQNISVILQPEVNTDKFGDVTQIPNDLMQDLNRIEDNSQLSYGLINKNFDRDLR